MMISSKLLLAAVIICLYAEFAAGDCPQNYVDIEGHCFLFFQDISINYLEAREVCQNNQGDLAVLDECNVFGSVVQHIHNNGLDPYKGYWIGASDAITDGDWQWITGAQVELGAPFWGRSGDGVNEPSGGTGQNCILMGVDDQHRFHDYVYTSLQSPLCQKPQFLGECESPFVKIGNGCFNFLHTLDETWADARVICQVGSADLAIVDDCNLMKDIINYMYDNGLSDKSYWIGGSDSAVEGDWKWINGATVAMGVPFWGRTGTGNNQPVSGDVGQDCAMLWRDDRYYFNDYSCTESLSPLCQAAPVS